MSHYESAWRLSSKTTDLRSRAVADRAFSELVRMNARIGRQEQVIALLAQVEGRAFTGTATELLASARDGLGLMKNRPDLAFRCGPGALDRIVARRDNTSGFHPFLSTLPSTEQGTSLAQIAAWADKVDLKMRPAFRSPGAPMLTPAVLHWKLGHFSAIFQQGENNYAVEDPTFLDSLTLVSATVDAEASGYFLVPQGPLPKGWREVDEAEAATIWGKGATGTTDINRTGPTDPKCKDEKCATGMPVANAHTMTVSLNIEDIPVSYSPPFGPSFAFQLTYNQREASQPAVPDFSNLGPKWVHNWHSFVDETITLVGDATVPDNIFPVVRTPGGGSLVYESGTALPGYTDVTFPNPTTRNASGRISKASDVYVVTNPDGSRLIFGRKVGLTAPYRYFLTQIEDTKGHAMTLAYDSQNRLTTITDALGQVSTFSYEFTPDPLRITKVTDPFGRFAVIHYDDDTGSPAYGRLISITDTINLTSTFTYQGSGDFIQAMTTPYGTTNFAYGESGTGGRDRWLEITDPLGDKERLECRNSWTGLANFSSGLRPTGMSTLAAHQEYRNSLYWDKKAYRETYNPNLPDQPHTLNAAHIYHWLHAYAGGAYNQTSGTLENEKRPLESVRTWYNYLGQTDPILEGPSSVPTKIGRVLEDGTTQLYQYEYNALDRVTKSIDPLGRTTTYHYDTNNIDLLEIRQVTGVGVNDYQRLFLASGYVAHQPASVTDAAGQTTTYVYNAKGQVSQVTNAKSEVTAYYYDPVGDPAGSRLPGGDRDPAAYGYLVAIDGPLTGTADTVTILYDAYGRPRTVTESEGYAVTTDYDDFDRPTLVTYPDATTHTLTYDRLDLVQVEDRRGHVTRTAYNALRQAILTTDALGHSTQYAYCKCGDLRLLVDAAGKSTTWTHDAAGRVTAKTFADQTTQFYNYEATSSRLKSVIDAKGQVATYAYHKDNALASVAYTNATIATPSVSYTYDTLYPRLASRTDGVGTTSYAYHAIPAGPSPAPTAGAGRLASIDGPWADDTQAYTYDELGRALTSSLNGSANTTTLTYDALGRVSSLVNPLGTFGHTYIGATARPSQRTYPNGQVTNYAYHPNIAATGTGNGDQRLQELEHLAPGGANLSTYGYTYDEEGMIKTWSRQLDTDAALTSTFGYDAVNQLTSAVLPSSPTTGTSHLYRYDKGGNRTSLQVDNAVIAATHNTLNQVTALSSTGPIRVAGTLDEPAVVTVNGQPAAVDASNTFSADVSLAPGTHTLAIVATDGSSNTATQTYEVTVGTGTAARTLTYDLNGNLLNDGAGRTFTWDAVNRLLSITTGGNVTAFVYDGASRRVIEKLNGTEIRRWVWGGGPQPIEERDATNAVTKRFYSGLGEQIAGVNYYYTTDHLGSVREMVDDTGAIRARYAYDPFGLKTKVSGDLEATFGFTGFLWHSASGLNLTLYRGYDISTGRWLSRDPIEESGGINLYGYVKNNPLNGVDLLGLDVLPTNFIGPLKQGDQRGLSAAQHAALKELIRRERAHGSIKAARMSSITFGDKLLEPFNSSYGNTVPTVYGAMDLDWFTDVQSMNYAGRYSAPPLYIGGKIIWSAARAIKGFPIGNAWPFQDPAERATFLALIDDNIYQSLFDLEFFNKYSPSNCE